MTQLQLAQRALKAARTHLRLATTLMPLNEPLRQSLRTARDEVDVLADDVRRLERYANEHLERVRRKEVTP